ncbi:MAG: FtsH protease activity modulator HflK [Gammaproteobacteria bacterium]
MVWNEPGKDKDPWNSAERPPDLERMVKSLQKRLGWLFGSKRGGQHHFHAAVLWWLVPIIIAAWLISGFYKVAPGDRGVHFVFGHYTGVTQPGLHWHIPWPVGHADIIGSVESRDYAHNYNRLLTRDGNIVVVDAAVHYHVVDLRAYLFNAAAATRVPENADAGVKTLLDALAGTAVRAAVAQSTLSSLMGGGQDAVEADARQRLDTLLKPYDSGIAVTRLSFQRVSLPEAVSSSDADVQAAQQDANQTADAAQAYADNVLPQAQSEADAKLKEADAYRTALVSQAQADTARFDAVLAAYRKAPALTREQLYMQTMENILSNTNKVVVDTRNGSVTVQLGQPFQSPPVKQPASAVHAPSKASTSTAPAAGTRPATAAPAASTTGGV